MTFYCVTVGYSMHFSPGIKTRWAYWVILSSFCLGFSLPRGVHRHMCFFECDVTSDLRATADMARVKQTTRHRHWYVMSSSSSPLSSVIESTSSPSLEKTVSDSPLFISRHTIESRMSRISSRCVQKMQQLGYFGCSVGRFGSRGGLGARGRTRGI
jgi:hypothetical protein